MPPVPTTDQQTADIQAYLNSFNTPDPSTLTGIEAYANLCGSCHGSEGQGTASGPIIQFPVAGYAKWVTRNGRPGADYPGPMSAYGTDRLTDAQLDEIIDFLGAQTRPTTGQGLYDTLCANCHGADGRGGPVGKGIVGEESGGKIREGSGGSNYAARLVYMPSWTPAELSNEEIALIDAYVGGL